MKLKRQGDDGIKMPEGKINKVGRDQFMGSLFLPKYQQIIKGLYMKAQKQDEQFTMEKIIPTMDELNEFKISNNPNIMKKDHN
jgi:hypothetical protein